MTQSSLNVFNFTVITTWYRYDDRTGQIVHYRHGYTNRSGVNYSIRLLYKQNGKPRATIRVRGKQYYLIKEK